MPLPAVGWPASAASATSATPGVGPRLRRWLAWAPWPSWPSSVGARCGGSPRATGAPKQSRITGPTGPSGLAALLQQILRGTDAKVVQLLGRVAGDGALACTPLLSKLGVIAHLQARGRVHRALALPSSHGIQEAPTRDNLPLAFQSSTMNLQSCQSSEASSCFGAMFSMKLVTQFANALTSDRGARAQDP